MTDVYFGDLIPCDGCAWYHEWFGVCCNGDSEQRGGVSWRCELYESDEKRRRGINTPEGAKTPQKGE